MTLPLNIHTQESHLDQISIPTRRLIIQTEARKKWKQNPEIPRNLATNPTLTIRCLDILEGHHQTITT